MKLTDNFTLEEFASPDADYFPIEVINNLYELASSLQVVRNRLGVALHVNSGWRTESHNRKVGGERNSQHLYGRAADIWSEIYSPSEIYEIIEQFIDAGVMQQGGLGLYKTFVHYDTRGKKARWNEQ